MVVMVGVHSSKLHTPGESCLYGAAELGPIVLKEWAARALLLWQLETRVRQRCKRIYLSSPGMALRCTHAVQRDDDLSGKTDAELYAPER
jgi:hypothetical protein